MNPMNFCLHKTLETKRGNQVSNGILYLMLCELLDIPVRAIQFPSNLLLLILNRGILRKIFPIPFIKSNFLLILLPARYLLTRM